MRKIRYDLIGADIDYGVKKHPQQDLIDRGIHWTYAEPVPIADCWIFNIVEDDIELPPYIDVLEEK